MASRLSLSRSTWHPETARDGRDVRRMAHNPATADDPTARRYVAGTRRNRQSKTRQRRITRGPLSCTDGMTCTDSSPDGTHSADCTGISLRSVPRLVPRPSRRPSLPPATSVPALLSAARCLDETWRAAVRARTTGLRSSASGRWLMSHTTCVSAVSGSLWSPRCLRRDVVPGLLHLSRLSLSRRVRFTIRFAEPVLDLPLSALPRVKTRAPRPVGSPVTVGRPHVERARTGGFTDHHVSTEHDHLDLL